MLKLGDRNFESRLLLGTARYPSLETLKESILRSKVEIITVSLRRSGSANESGLFDCLRSLNLRVLPNTAGCRSVKEAVTTARMAREIFATNWIKLETVGDEFTLQPNPFALVEATRILLSEGFEVFPYTTDDLVVADHLVRAGCKILMPWGSPIGSGQGLWNLKALKALRARFPKTTMIVDAGLGAPSHASQALELGMDGVLLNSAVALADDPPAMAEAFALAIRAGRMAFDAGLMAPREFASPSTPIIGQPFQAEDRG